MTRYISVWDFIDNFKSDEPVEYILICSHLDGELDTFFDVDDLKSSSYGEMAMVDNDYEFDTVNGETVLRIYILDSVFDDACEEF